MEIARSTAGITSSTTREIDLPSAFTFSMVNEHSQQKARVDVRWRTQAKENTERISCSEAFFHLTRL